MDKQLPIIKIEGTDEIVDRSAFDLRVNKEQLPVIDIAGHPFFVDLRVDMLRPKDDFLSEGIVFSDIENYYDEYARTYTIPYDPKKRQFAEIDHLHIEAFPKDLIAVSFPHERLLDPLGWNRVNGYDLTHGLEKTGLKLNFTAEVVPWEKTYLSYIVADNKKQSKKKPVAQTKAAKQGSSKKRRM